jgi:hypothetical protein
MAGIIAVGQSAYAQTFSTSFVNPTSGSTDKASATFSLITGTTSYLHVVLTNTSTIQNYQNVDLLSGFFFSLAASPTLTPTSATTSSAIINAADCQASAVTLCSTAPVDVGYQWQYEYSGVGFHTSTESIAGTYGVATSGYSSLTPTFGKGNTTPFGANAPDLGGKGTSSLAFSIVGSSFVDPTKGGLATTELVNTSIAFNWALPTGVSSLNVSNVTFTYGTAPDVISKASEPTTVAIVGTGLLALTIVRSRRRPAHARL